jgi:dTDP-4-amino-4,6-dideoxygalactose transaminase
MRHLEQVLNSGYIGQGPQVEAFETQLQESFHLPHRPLTVNSCTSAIDLALHLCGVGPGDEVITTPLTCTATNTHISLRRAIPVWADVSPNTGLIDPMSVSMNISSRTKAIIGVDWGGSMADYRAIRAHAGSIPIIQDAAHTMGSWSIYADFTAWSFQAIKFLTTGDGGALRVPPDLYARAKLLRWFGLDRESSSSFRCAQDIVEPGFKYHMNDISATIGISNLDLAFDNAALHRTNAHELIAHIRTLSNLRHYNLHLDDMSHSWILFIHTPDRVDFTKLMTAHGIETGLVHVRNDRHTGFGGIWNQPSLGLDTYTSTYTALPCGWWMGLSDLDRVCSTLSEWNDLL